MPRRPPVALPAGDRRDGDRAGPGSRACSPTTRASWAPPTFRTRGTHGSPRRSRSRATGPRSPSSAPHEPLVTEAMALDRQRIAGEDGLTWTPQFRDIEALARMIDRVGERAALALFISNLTEQVAGRQGAGRRGGRRLPDARPGRLRPPQGVRHPPAPQPARLPARGHLMSATHDREPSGGVRGAAASRRRPARQARPRLPGALRPLDGDPAAAVPGVGADRPRPLRPRAHRDPLPHRLPRLRHPARHPRADPRQHARAAGGAALLRGRAARDLPRQAHQTLDDRARHRAQPNRRTPTIVSSRSTGGCSRSRGWKPTASASTRPARSAAGSSATRSERRSPT